MGVPMEKKAPKMQYFERQLDDYFQNITKREDESPETESRKITIIKGFLQGRNQGLDALHKEIVLVAERDYGADQASLHIEELYETGVDVSFLLSAFNLLHQQFDSDLMKAGDLMITELFKKLRTPQGQKRAKEILLSIRTYIHELELKNKNFFFPPSLSKLRTYLQARKMKVMFQDAYRPLLPPN